MDARKITNLKSELASVRREAVAAHIAGDSSKAACLTGKAVGMKSTLEVAEKILSGSSDISALGELEGVERVISALGPVPKCSQAA